MTTNGQKRAGAVSIESARDRSAAPVPRLSLADVQAYQRVAALEVGTEIRLDGKPAKYEGLTGYLITIKPRGARVIYLRAGDPRIAEIANGL